MKVTTIQTNGTGGELSPRLDGRVDIAKFKNGLRVLENVTVLPHGGMRKRSAFKYVVTQKNATDDVYLVPFSYNVEQSYMLMFGPNYVWFMKDRAVITFTAATVSGVTQANPAVLTTSAAHGYTTGDRVIVTGIVGMTELNNRQFVVVVLSPTTIELQGVNSTTYTAYSSGGSVAKIVELATTYAGADLPTLMFVQSADTLYITHPNYPLRKITRTSHTAWTLSEPSITTGPFRQINSDRTARMVVTSFSGAASGYGTHAVGETCTLTSSTSFFTSSMVGALFRLHEEGGATGIRSAPIADTTQTIAANDVYTNEGRIYGVFTVSGAANWGSFNRVPAHDSGTVRVNGSGTTYFDSDFLHPGYCVVRVTGYTSTTQVTVQIVRYQMPASIVTSGTTFWEEGAWSSYRGYPRAITFYEQRLFLAGSLSDPTNIWGSRSAAYEDFEDGPDNDDALVYRITSGLADTIRWLSSGRVLTAGTSSGEYAISASSQNEALTPSNVKVSPQTTYGTSECPPVRINQATLYPQRQGAPTNAARKLREFAYAYESDSYQSTDLTVFSEHITGSGFVRIAYQVEPDSIIWTTRSDGQMAACTYERAQEVVAWHRHRVAGTSAVVKTCAVIPGADGDEVWISVERTIDGAAQRSIEVLMPAFKDTDDKTDAFFVDSGLTYSGTSTSTISGLWHLRGQSVQVLNNGSVESATVSSVGRITLANATTKAQVGLGYTGIIETEDFEAGAQGGTAQSRAKRISQIWVRVLNSLGGTCGPDSSTQKTINYRTPAMPMGSSPPLQSGLIEIDFAGRWERFGRVRLEHNQPLPFHVTGIVAELNVTG